MNQFVPQSRNLFSFKQLIQQDCRPLAFILKLEFLNSLLIIASFDLKCKSFNPDSQSYYQELIQNFSS